MRNGEIAAVKMEMGALGPKGGARQQCGNGQAARGVSRISEECQVDGVEAVFWGAGGERFGKRAQNQNLKVSDSANSPRERPGFWERCLVGFICLWRLESSGSSFGSPDVRGLLQVIAEEPQEQ